MFLSPIVRVAIVNLFVLTSCLDGGSGHELEAAAEAKQAPPEQEKFTWYGYFQNSGNALLIPLVLGHVGYTKWKEYQSKEVITFEPKEIVEALLAGEDGEKTWVKCQVSGPSKTQKGKLDIIVIATDGTQAETPTVVDKPDLRRHESPGMYKTRQKMIVNSDFPMTSEEVGELELGKLVEVVEIADEVVDGRVRGRILEPAGWISIVHRDLKTKKGLYYRWVDKVSTTDAASKKSN